MKYSRFLPLLLLIACSSNKSDWPLLPFVKLDNVNPVLEAGNNTFICPVLNQEVKWDEKDVFNPAVVVKDDKVYMIFRAEDKIGKYAGTSRLGLAISDDGLYFTKQGTPVFYPDNDSLKIYEWEGGVEDPRIVESPDGTYVMTYTGYDGSIARLLIATSKDLQHWTKQGLVLTGKYKDTWSKSGAIVAKRNGTKIIAEKIDDKYWMYFGDTDLFMATSDDLIHWNPVVEANDSLKSVLKPRSNMFDSELVESGPYALITDNGILLLYNGMDHDTRTYSSGQALFDLNDPTKLISRLDDHFLTPDKPYELVGQVNKVCFIEGMVPFKTHWWLYYGTADSKIAVAMGPDLPAGAAEEGLR
ncbi:MAG: glycoside hydrolase family 130 protein [Bacteroidota bacterium]